LGAIYHHGWGQERDYVQALFWYRKAAEQGLPGAKSNLGVMYENGLGVGIDYQQAANWYRAAAEQGDVSGQFNLASLYMEGKGVPLDYVTADLWYTMASSAGDNLSARQLKDLERLMTPRQLREAQTSVRSAKRGTR
jgi:TPR repeat protein